MKVNEVLRQAEEELNYVGKKSAKDLDIKDANTIGDFTKYARDLYEAGYYNGNKQSFAWCCVYNDWLFWKVAGSKEEAIKVHPYSDLNAGVTWMKKAYQNAGRLDTTPRVGDSVFFTDKSGALAHVGLVIEVNDDTIKTNEGNVGHKVVNKTYKLTDKFIDSYGHPFYEDEPAPVPEDWKTIAEWQGLDNKVYRLQEK